MWTSFEKYHLICEHQKEVFKIMEDCISDLDNIYKVIHFGFLVVGLPFKKTDHLTVEERVKVIKFYYKNNEIAYYLKNI